MKECTKCGRLLPKSDFYMLARGGLRADCRYCCSDAAIARQQRGKVPCCDCGEKQVRSECYRIQPPGERLMHMCTRCWEALVGAAAMEAVR